MTNEPGFSLRAGRPELLRKKPKDWRTYIQVFSKYLPESSEVVSLGDRYFLSLGAHYPNAFYLMDEASSEPLTIDKTFIACALISFATDSPVIPGHTEEQRQYRSPDFKSTQKEFQRAGLRSTKSYFEALASVAEAVTPLVDIGLPHTSMSTRVVPDAESGKWAYLCWPTSDATWRALTAYWSAMISVALPGRILNFWRAVEAVTTQPVRYDIFGNLHLKQVKAVKTTLGSSRRKNHKLRSVNSTIRLKQLALSRRDALAKLHGSTNAALDWLFWEIRGKAAHADKYSLDFEGLSSLGDQLRDAILFQYMARVAIEERWS